MSFSDLEDAPEAKLRITAAELTQLVMAKDLALRAVDVEDEEVVFALLRRPKLELEILIRPARDD